jgi:hypothetical protein
MMSMPGNIELSSSVILDAVWLYVCYRFMMSMPGEY